MNSLFEAEKAVIGSILLDAACVPAVSSLLSPSDLSMAIHQDILRTVYTMQQAAEAIDPVTIMGKLAEQGHPVHAAYIFELVEMTPTAANVMEYAQIVKSSAIKQQLKEIGLYLCESDEPDPLTLLSEAGKRMEDVGQCVKSSIVSSFDSCRSFMDYRSVVDRGAESVYVKTGFSKLDTLLGGGLLNEGLYILAARPGQGKSTTAISIADNVASRGEPVLFVTLEMSEKQITSKRIARLSSVPSDVVLMGKLNADEYQRVAKATAELANRPLFINHKPSATIAEIGAMASNIKGCRLIVVDYLGLIRPEERKKSRYEITTDLSSSLKQLARRLGIPVLCLAQLNRQNEQRINKKPQLSDLRDSGCIEQDADGVIFLYSKDYYSEEKGNPMDAKQLDVILEKNRHGATGKVSMAFYGATSKITS